MSPVTEKGRRRIKRKAGSGDAENPKALILESGKVRKMTVVMGEQPQGIAMYENSDPIGCDSTYIRPNNNNISFIHSQRRGRKKLRFYRAVKVQEIPGRHLLKSRRPIPDDIIFPMYFNHLTGTDEDSLDSSHVVDAYEIEESPEVQPDKWPWPRKSILKLRSPERTKEESSFEELDEDDGQLFILDTTDDDDFVPDFPTAFAEAEQLVCREFEQFEADDDEAGETSAPEVTEPNNAVSQVMLSSIPEADEVHVHESLGEEFNAEEEVIIPEADEVHVHESLGEEFNVEEEVIIPEADEVHVHESLGEEFNVEEEVIIPEEDEVHVHESLGEEVNVEEEVIILAPESLPDIMPEEVIEEDQFSQPLSPLSVSSIIIQDLVQVSSAGVGISVTLQSASEMPYQEVPHHPVLDPLLPQVEVFRSSREDQLDTNIQEPPSLDTSEMEDPSDDPIITASPSYWPIRVMYNLWTAAKRRLSL